MSDPTKPSLVLPANPRAAYLAQKAEIDAAIQEALAGANYILGDQVTAFESEYADWMGGGSCIGLANGTDAVELSLRACGVQPGDLVAIPTHTAVATATAVIRAEARPVFVDVDPETFLMDLSSLRAVIESGAHLAAVVPVHLYGLSCDMDALGELSRQYGFSIMEDCSQAHGALWKGQKVGTFGKAAAFSCYPTKNLGAIGDAGLAFTKDAGVAKHIQVLRQYGWRERYISDEVGMNSRLDELQAAILRVKLRQLDAHNAARHAIATRYNEALANLNLKLPEVVPGHVFHQYTILSKQRDALKAHLASQGVIASILYPAPIHLQPAYREIAEANPVPLTQAEQACGDLLCLPMHQYLTDAEFDRVVEGVRSFRG